MAAGTYRTSALVLKHTKLKETDVILTLLSENGCQIRAVAKGLRRPGSKFGARLEPYSCVSVLLHKGKSLDIVREVSVLSSHALLREDILLSSAAAAVCDVAGHLSNPDICEPKAFPMAQRALDVLEETESADELHLILLVAAYTLKAASLGGWRPHLTSCVLCDAPLEEKLVTGTWFSPEAGGALCASCSPGVIGSQRGEPGVHEWAHVLLGSTFSQIKTYEPSIDVARDLLRASALWLTSHIDTRTRALEFFQEVTFTLSE